MRFAADTGGTFTDLIVEDDKGALRMFKARTTPDDPIRGVLDALQVAADALGVSRQSLLASGEMFVHGTTRAINAIVTGTTARTALLTTLGNPEVLVLRDGGRIEPFNFTVPYPAPYSPLSYYEGPNASCTTAASRTTLDDSGRVGIIERLRSSDRGGRVSLWVGVQPAHEFAWRNPRETSAGGR